MKRSTFRILFYINRSKIKKNGCCPIMGRISVDNGIAQFSTGREIKPSDWSVEKEEASRKTADAKGINRTLDHIREQLQRHYDRIVERDGFITAERLKNELTGITAKNTGLLAEACALKDEVLKGVGVTHAPATCKGYENSYKNLWDYVNGQLEMEDVAFTALDYSFIENYDFFLKIHKKLKEHSVIKHMIFLRKVVRLAVLKKMIPRDPFEGYTPDKAGSERKWLSVEELNRIMDITLSWERANFVRHMFIFSSFTGLARADLENLKVSDIHVNKSGGKEIRIQRIKTDIPCIVPLTEIPLQIISKYEGTGLNGKLFPKLGSDNAHRFTKYIAAKAGLDIDLTFHMARHTFSTMCLSKGMSIETLSQILGHRSINTTQIYAKITNRKISEDMAEVAMRMEKKTRRYITNDVVKPRRIVRPKVSPVSGTVSLSKKSG